MNVLTRRQQAIYEFIVQQIHSQGMPPTLVEIADAFNLRSVAGVSDHLKAIERKGYIRRRPGRSRGIEVRSIPSAATPRAHSVPVIGRVPSSAGVHRTAAPRVAVDARWAGADAVAFTVATDDLAPAGILAEDLIVVDRNHPVGAGDLIVGRQGRELAILQIGSDGLSATARAGRIDHSLDVRAYGCIVAIVRTPQRHLARAEARR